MFTNRTFTLFIFNLVVLVSLFFTSLGITPVYAANISVNTAVDEATTNGFCSLREAIINANKNDNTHPDCVAGDGTDTITFSGNYTITLVNGQLPAVTSSIIINGNGAANTIIQANASPNIATYRVFLVSSSAGNLTLNGLTVRHGRCIGGCESSTDDGGGIFAAGNTITVTNSTISGNSAEDGGGITNGTNSTLTVTNSTISGNSAADRGGGIYNLYGTVAVTNSTISGNNAVNRGGGISDEGGGATVTVTNSSLYNNSAEDGGGIYNENNGTLNIWGSTFSANSAGTGGALYNNGNMGIANSTLSGNEAYDFGGAIYNVYSTWIYNSSIVFNTLIEGTEAGAGGIAGNVALYNSIVAGNMRAISSTYQDCSGTIHSEGRNLFSTTTNCTINVVSGSVGLLSLNSLGPLQNNGGPTSTHGLLLGSNAIDTGDNNLCSFFVYNLDQRGVARPYGSLCDVGAYEYLQTFADVPSNAFGWAHIESIFEAGITGGCGNNNYCPSGTVTRAQMAVFLMKGIHGSSYTPPPASGNVFNDVPANSFAAAYIEAFADEGITGGCGGGNFCPNGLVTRAQMAVFLLKAKHGSGFTPPAATGTMFSDVSVSSFAAAWIEQLANEGITGGCGGGNYCPNNSVTRAQMAVFLQKTFNLLLP